MIVEMKREKDKDKVMRKGAELQKKWRVTVDEDLTMEKRRVKWSMVERAKKERREGKMVAGNKRMWAERKKLRQVEGEEG